MLIQLKYSMDKDVPIRTFSGIVSSIICWRMKFTKQVDKKFCPFKGEIKSSGKDKVGVGTGS
jgi:hypothetical protein